LLALAPTGRAKGCGLQIAYAATEVLKQRSDLRSERSKSDSLTLVTDATSLHPVRSRFYCSVVPKRRKLASLSVSHPNIAREASGWDPKLYFQGSNKKLKWKCSKRHIYECRISHRTSGHGCPFCAGKKVLKGFNDLATKYPKLSKEAYEWDPRNVIAGSHKKLAWKCKDGHIYLAQVSSRTTTIKTGCPICSNKKLLVGFNDLATTNPGIAQEAYGWDPKTVFAGTNKKLNWKCKKQHIFQAQVSSRTRKLGTICPICSNKKLLVGFNDLATTHPDVAKEADGWDPRRVIFGTNQKLRWMCKYKHKYIAVVASRTGERKSGCAVCANQKLLIGFNDLATTFPLIASQADGWDTRKFVAGSHIKKKWICENKHRWVSQISSRTNQGSGCPSCATYGFDPNENAFLYFIYHSRWQMLQIGITNVPDVRLSIHRRNGWKLQEIRGPMDGHLTQQWETAILRMLKAKGADLSNKEIAGKFDGYSEAWSKSTFSVKSIKELMRMTEEFEEKI
jgi:hypothetical protein